MAIISCGQKKLRATGIKNISAELVEMNFNRSETIGAAFKDIQKLFLLTPFGRCWWTCPRTWLDKQKKRM
jgi:hypothetical protein